jgi:hypothetical protein
MSERAAKSAQATQAHRGVAYAIPHAQVEEHWSSIEGKRPTVHWIGEIPIC